MELLHIIPNLGPGGPTRSLTSFVEWSRDNSPALVHRIVSLESRVYPLLAFRLRRCGAPILSNADAASIDQAMARADVVLMHFWNTPVLWRLIARRTPPVRPVIWAKVRGDHAPQRFNAGLFRSAAAVALTAKAAEALLPDLESAAIVPGLVQPDRVERMKPLTHSGFRVDYVGTTNSGKLDVQFFSIISDLAIPEVKVRIFGGALEPALAAAHAGMREPSRIEIGGFTENIAEVFATTDVFAFPMAENSYGSSDLVVQEAMLAGLPVVAYAGRGPSQFIDNETTGLLVSSAAEFTGAIERLYRDPGLRHTLGAAAARYARAEFGSGKHVARLAELVERAATAPKGPWFTQHGMEIDLGHLTSGALFLVSQGWSPADAVEAVKAWTAGEDDRLIAFAWAASEACYKVEGGIIHWRNHEPNDPLLRFWSGCWLKRSGRHDEANAEFDTALRLGAPPNAVARFVGRE